jgi:hypothetical protein
MGRFVGIDRRACLDLSRAHLDSHHTVVPINAGYSEGRYQNSPNGNKGPRLDHEIANGPAMIVKVHVPYLADRPVRSLDMEIAAV